MIKVSLNVMTIMRVSLNSEHVYDVYDIETKHTHRTTKWMYMSMTRHMEPQSGRTCEW